MAAAKSYPGQSARTHVVAARLRSWADRSRTRLDALFAQAKRLGRRASPWSLSFRARLGLEVPPRDAAVFGPVSIPRTRLLSVILHYAKLDGEDRAHRFNARVTLPALLRRYSSPEGRSSTFFGFMSQGAIVALAELNAMAANGETELAISVLAPWQNRGLGEAVLRTAIGRVCHDDGRDLVLHVNAQNKRMVRLVTRLGATRDGDQTDGRYIFPRT
ncbi:MAG: GNAT family N-acetyltransferase [Rhodobacteraceae bacterium]|nr:GNAT family N-acetyltransferase [Paracoccaceae bacterium]